MSGLCRMAGMDDTHRLTGIVRMNGIAGLVGRVGMDANVAIAVGTLE